MSDSPPTDDDWSFEESLATLVERAYRDGADPEGAWKCTIEGNGQFHWDVQITRVEYGDADDRGTPGP